MGLFTRKGRERPASSPAWEGLRAANLGVATARQLRAARDLAGGEWDLDTAAGTVTVGPLQSRVEILGNLSQESGTWMAGWAVVELNGLDRSLARRSLHARETGHRLEVPQLLERTVPADETLAAEIAYVAGNLSGPVTVYRGPHESGAVFFTLEDHVGEPLETAQVPGAILEALNLGVNDPRHLVTRLLTSEGFALEEKGTSVRGERDGDVLEVGFDEVGRVSGIEVRASGAGSDQGYLLE